MSYTSIRLRVRDLHQLEDSAWFARMDDDTDIATEEHRAIQAALRAYSLDRPRRRVARWAAVGGTTYEYVLSTQITGWDDDWIVTKVVYPEGKQDRNRLDDNDWDVYLRPSDSAWVLRFVGYNPPSGEDLAVYYTRPHVLDSTEDTISSEEPADVGAFEYLAAAECLEIAANYYARRQSSSVTGDAVDYGSLSRNYAERARECRERYERHVKSRRKRTCVFVDWDTPQIGGYPSLRFPPGTV